jgi:Rps23 Pro-64 3,4-dihydroxylase Tpa1-like proline 4-hydroxylase
MADPARCGYWHGTDAVGPAYERVRAVAVLFYVGNEPWRPGDGGETGLYETADLPVDRPSVAVPPVNNRLLAFECTPTSFHSFISNRRSGRTSMIQWLHRSREEAVGRWGENSLVLW